MSKQIILIKTIQTDETLAIGQRNKEVQLFEGAWYFDQNVVDMTHLIQQSHVHLPVQRHLLLD